MPFTLERLCKVKHYFIKVKDNRIETTNIKAVSLPYLETNTIAIV